MKKRILKIAGIIVGVLILWRIVSACLFVTVELEGDWRVVVNSGYSAYVFHTNVQVNAMGARTELTVLRWNVDEMCTAMVDNINEQLEILKQLYSSQIAYYEFDERSAVAKIYTKCPVPGEKSVDKDILRQAVEFNALDFICILLNAIKYADKEYLPANTGRAVLIEGKSQDGFSYEDINFIRSMINIEAIGHKELANNVNWNFDEPEGWEKVEWKLYEGVYYLKRIDFSGFLNLPKVADLSKLKHLKSIKVPSRYIKKILLPEGMTSLEDKAFQYCHDLREVHIPVSLKSIGSQTFEDCWNLEKIFFEGNAPEDIGKDVFINVGAKPKIYYKKGTKGWDDEYWSDFEMIEMKDEE